jgi:hypothetical protein
MSANKDHKKRQLGKKKLSVKVRDDGKAIAAAEHAVHRLKNTVNEGKMSSSARQVTPFENLPNLLTSVEEQEAAWLLAVADPLHFAARVPISQSTGCVPVDLYRKTVAATMTASAYDVCFAICAQDRWSTFGSWRPVDWYTGMLGADGDTGVWCNVTGSTYTSINFPAQGAVVTGSTSLAIGNVSSDIVSDSTIGTEYIMVGSMFTLASKMVANAAVDARYSGRVTVFMTTDPQRVPIAGNGREALMTLSREQNPLVFARVYIITSDGLFVPEDSQDSTPLAEITASAVPISTTAYIWNRVGEVGLSSTLYVPMGAAIGFAVEAPSGTQFELTGSYLWQLEKFSTNKVSDRLDDVPFFSPDSAYYDEDDLDAIDNDTMEFVSIPGPGGKTQVVSSVKPRKKKRIHHAAYRGVGVVPPAALTFANAVVKYPGAPIHPAVPVLSAVSAAAQQPGIHQKMSELAARAPHKIGVIAPKLANLVAEHGPKAAQIFHESVTKKPASSWWSKIKNIASGAWDVAKFAAPLVMSLL